MSEPLDDRAMAAVEKPIDPRWEHEVMEGGVYSSLGDELVRYRTALKALETRAGTALEVAPTESEVKLLLGPHSSPLRKQVEDFASLNADLEALVRRIEL